MIHTCLRVPDFIHFTTADGLPSNFEILVMTTDAEGFLCVGKNNGPARFDGRCFVPFNELNSSQTLPEKLVRTLYADSQGLKTKVETLSAQLDKITAALSGAGIAVEK